MLCSSLVNQILQQKNESKKPNVLKPMLWIVSLFQKNIVTGLNQRGKKLKNKLDRSLLRIGIRKRIGSLRSIWGCKLKLLKLHSQTSQQCYSHLIVSTRSGVLNQGIGNLKAILKLSFKMLCIEEGSTKKKTSCLRKGVISVHLF